MNFIQEIFGVKNIFPSNKIAVQTHSQSVAYHELEDQIDRTSSQLRRIDLKENEYVGVLSNNSPDFVILIFSLWKIGAVPLLINSRLLESEVSNLLSFAGCMKIFISKDLPGKYNFSNVKKSIFPFSDLLEKDNFSFNIDFEKTAIVIFTSGSTGKPKGVEITFNNLFQSAMIGNQYFKHKQNDRWLASLPFYHIGGFSIIMRAFIFGATLLFPESLDINSLGTAVSNLRPTHASFVSTQLKRLIESGIKPNGELREILLGGGFIDASLMNEALDRGWNAAKSFGASETSSFVSVLTAEQFTSRTNSAGKALPPNEILIVDEDKNILPTNETGEIVIKASSMAKGYLNNFDETKKKFRTGFYYTGDFGFLDNDGFLYVEARRDDLIVTGGENVNPLEVENELLKHPFIIEASVFSFMEKEWGQIVAAALVTKNNIEITLDELKPFLKGKISSFKHPKKIFIVDSLPKTELGKVQKDKLKDILAK